MCDEKSFLLCPGTDQGLGDIVGLIAGDIAHHYHAQVQARVIAHRSFKFSIDFQLIDRSPFFKKRLFRS